jgi:hypothetical protein
VITATIIGTIHYGKRHYRTDGDDGEIFETTKWFSFFCLPIVPLRSYTIQRERRHDLIQAIAWTFRSETIHVLARRRLDIPQVLTTYVKGWLSFGLIIWAFIVFAP